MSDINRSYSVDLSVVLFFTRGVSLRVWDETGMFEREVALYRRLQLLGVNVTFVTYGDGTDLDYQNRIPDISICCNRWNLPDWLYAKLIPWLHRKALKTVDLVKTNQTCGADIALAAARHWKKPLLARCGYMWSKNAALKHGGDSEYALESLAVENKVFCAADFIAVTTGSMRSCIQERFPGLERKVTVIPNYVDTELFTPARYKAMTRPRLCYVGRLDQEKNLEALIAAVLGLEIELEIIGCGTLHDKLATIIAGNSQIRLVGMVPNNRLPDHFRRCALFILPSLYEGHPKALLEAMACGVPVIGTDVSGINEVINHGQTGWLCKPDADSIREAIQKVLADNALQERLGSNASRYVVENFALERIVEMELDIYRHILCKGRK
jgi:glycosyltransferase involved in cell wall biosynthesis